MKRKGLSGVFSESIFFKKKIVLLVCALCVCLLCVILITTTGKRKNAAETTTETTNGTAEAIVTERTQDTDKETASDQTEGSEIKVEESEEDTEKTDIKTVETEEEKEKEETESEAEDSEIETEEEKAEVVTLTFGMKGDDVLLLQKSLESLWYPGFIADGDFGENTQHAVQLFQFYNGLPITGEADEETQNVLYSDEAVYFEALGENSTGNPVQYVQEYLCEAGFLEDKPDGSFGPGTEAAVRVFQTVAGITSPDGTVGKETILKMLEEPVTFEPLKLNDTGVLVTALQGKLQELGFLQKEELASAEEEKKEESATEDGDKKEETDKEDENAIETTDAVENEDTIETTNASEAEEETTTAEVEKKEETATTDVEKEEETTIVDVEKEETTGTPAADEPETVVTYDTEMERAVKEFQMYAGLEITGVADVETCDEILCKAATFTRLDRGAKGTAVEGLQIALKDLGYLSMEPDGSYGDETKKAVRDFQVVNSLSRDGSFGKKTADVLFGDPLAYDQEVLDNAGNDAEAFAKEILDEVGWDLYAAFEWSASLPYKSQFTGYNTTDSAIYSFINRSADCLGYASTFYWMAKALGYEARAIGGYVPYRETDELGDHAWVEVDIDGVTYICDPNYENQEHKNGYMLRYDQSGIWQYVSVQVLDD